MTGLAYELFVLAIKVTTTSSCRVGSNVLKGQGVNTPIVKYFVEMQEHKFGLVTDSIKYQLLKEPGQVLEPWEETIVWPRIALSEREDFFQNRRGCREKFSI